MPHNYTQIDIDDARDHIVHSPTGASERLACFHTCLETFDQFVHSKMATLWRITALMLSGFMGFIKAVSVCDVVNPLGAHDFCKYLTGSPELSDFNDRTSNITILAFNNATKTSESSFGDMSDPERNAFLRYHIIRGIHSSQTLVKAQMDTISNMTILETYLSGEGLANVTDGQKLEYLIIDPGDESSNYSSFTTGIDVAGVDTMVRSISSKIYDRWANIRILM